MTTDPLVHVARDAIVAALSSRTYDPPALGAPAALFVTLHARDGALRGCIGHLVPTRTSLGAQVAETAVLAATEDPRFPPLAADELDGLGIEVDVLGPTEPAEPAELDPSRYGVVVTSGIRRGVLLPGIEGIDTCADQLAIARRKGGIGPDEPVRIERFEVRRHR